MSNKNKIEVPSQNTTTPEGKKPFLSNLGSIFKKGGQSLKDKITNLTTSVFKNKQSKLAQEGNTPQIHQKSDIIPAQTIEKTKKISEVIATNSPKKKEFNIQLSDDGDKENVYHLNDEEEEEEEGEFEYIEENEIEANKKTNEPQCSENKNTTIQSSTVPPKEEKPNSGSKLPEDEANQKKKKVPNEEEVDSNTVCHRIYYKGSVIDIREIITHKFLKQKSKSSFFSMIGISNKKSIEKHYLALFDENYLYFLKDIEVDKENSFLRRIGNKYNFNLLNNVQFDEYESKQWKVLMEYFKSPVSEDTIEKVLYFDHASAERFYMVLNETFRRLKMPFGGNEYNNNQEEAYSEMNNNNSKGVSDQRKAGDGEKEENVQEEAENI